MMEAVTSSETSVSIYQTTRRNIPEDGHLNTHRRENLKHHQKVGRIDLYIGRQMARWIDYEWTDG
jgi:hypothetical protein